MHTEVWTLTDAAKFLRLHPMTLYKLARERRVPAKKVGGSWRFTRAALEAWLSQVPPR